MISFFDVVTLKYHLSHILSIAKGDQNLGSYFLLEVVVFVALAGCMTSEPINSPADTIQSSPAPVNSIKDGISPSGKGITATALPTAGVRKPLEENYSEAVEVDYRKFVDWFMEYNIRIRGYAPDDYVCGQYTADMINASKRAGFNAYFAAVRFSDGTGHALLAFKSTHFGITSWYFFEPQTNNQMNPLTIKEVLQDKMGKTVTDVTVYGYYDDAGDKDPATWRFAYPLYNIKY